MLAGKEARMPDAIGLDDEAVPMPQLVDAVRATDAGCELCRSNAGRATGNQGRQHLSEAPARCLFSPAGHPEAGEKNVIIDRHHDVNTRTLGAAEEANRSSIMPPSR